MTAEQEQNKLDKKMREAMEELDALLKKHNVELAFQQMLINGQTVGSAIVLVPKEEESKIITPHAVLRNPLKR